MKSKKAIKEYRADCKKALEGYDEDGKFIGKPEPDDELIYEGIIEGLDFVLNEEGEQISLNIDVTTNDCDDLKSGEEFEWNFDGIDVRLFNPDKTDDPNQSEDSEDDIVTKDEQSKLNIIADFILHQNYPKSANGIFAHSEAYDIEMKTISINPNTKEEYTLECGGCGKTLYEYDSIQYETTGYTAFCDSTECTEGISTTGTCLERCWWDDEGENDEEVDVEIILFHVKFGQQDDCHNTTHSIERRVRRDVLAEWDGIGLPKLED